jgi:hypothetical protein
MPENITDYFLVDRKEYHTQNSEFILEILLRLNVLKNFSGPLPMRSGVQVYSVFEKYFQLLNFLRKIQGHVYQMGSFPAPAVAYDWFIYSLLR